MNNVLKEIISSCAQAYARKNSIEAVPDFVLEVPKDKALANISTNIAMQLARLKKGTNPLDVANEITASIRQELANKNLSHIFSKIEVKSPGFINFHFSNKYLQSVIQDIEALGANFGRINAGRGEKVLLEFVSANPTGPLSVAHGRQAAVGNALSNILKFAGCRVKNEFYLNDEGNQINLLGESIYARYCELQGETYAFPEGGYKGDYIYDIAKDIINHWGGKFLRIDKQKAIKSFADIGVGSIMAGIKKDLEDFGVRFDNYYSQQKLSKSGKVEKALKALSKKGLLYEQEGALWFSSTKFGDDKDRVLRKSDGLYTYITPDIAYHEDKFKRGFTRLIDLWGPDHHGYIPRLKASVSAMGRDADKVSLLIIQLATISKGGKPLKMSTREGEFITLREIMDEVGKDVAKFFFLTRRKDSHLDFDLELAKKESSENPVYYIQYAHARICGILEHQQKNKIKMAGLKNLELLNSEEELAVLRTLREFPSVVQWSAQNLEPHRIIEYLMELASQFHLFYSRHRVVTSDEKLTAARLELVKCLKSVFQEALDLLGISCPEKM